MATPPVTRAAFVVVIASLRRMNCGRASPGSPRLRPSWVGRPISLEAQTAVATQPLAGARAGNADKAASAFTGIDHGALRQRVTVGSVDGRRTATLRPARERG